MLIFSNAFIFFSKYSKSSHLQVYIYKTIKSDHMEWEENVEWKVLCLVGKDIRAVLGSSLELMLICISQYPGCLIIL